MMMKDTCVVPLLVSTVLEASSPLHVAAEAARLLMMMHDEEVVVLLKSRVGKDRLLAVFRAVLRSTEWQRVPTPTLHLVDASAAGSPLYPPRRRRRLLKAFEAAQQLFEERPPTNVPSQQVEHLMAQMEMLKKQHEEELMKHQQQHQPVEGGVAFEALQKRDRELTALRSQLNQAHQEINALKAENDRLLVMLAEQEMQLQAK